MLRLLWLVYWKLSGWKLRGRFPYEHKKMVMIVAPHTSWKDVIIGFAARAFLKIEKAKFIGKKELFDGPFGWLFRLLGGVPVDRFSSQGVVEQVAGLFKNNNEFLLAMAPEGTRKRVDKLRTGFYHIAKAANVPILMVGLDFENKELVLGDAFYAGNNEAEDFNKILRFYSQIKGKNPESDLRHLVDTASPT
jgi:1-acyl-sn-glycerol-3-phosphate acyltransferase